MTIENILFKQKDYCISIRAYYKEHKDLFQNFPYLCYHADGKTGFSAQYYFCYTYGLWQLSPKIFDFLSCYVDCASGNLVYVHDFKNYYTDLKDQYLLMLTNNDFDIVKEYENLLELSKKEKSSYLTGSVSGICPPLIYKR